jgi:prepilin-type N-terminal cleavage/methylation domain-containing protein
MKMHTRPTTRSAFSLIEMLVVIGIMAFLTAAIVAVIPRVQNSAKIAATRATITKVDKLLNDRLDGFKRWIQTQDTKAGTSAIPSYVDQQSLTFAANSPLLAKIIGIKSRFRENFAQSLAELPLPGWQGNTAYAVGALVRVQPSSSSNLTFRCTATTGSALSGASAPSWPSTPGQTVVDSNLTWQLVPINPLTDNAACLYLVCTRAAIFDTEPPEASDFRPSEATDTDGDGLLEFVDAWAHPLRYYRWPTRLIRVSTVPTAAQTISTGPPPSYGLQVNPTWTLSDGSNVANVSARALIPSLNVAGFPTPSLTMLAEQQTLVVKDLAKDPDDPYGLIQTALTQTNPTPPFTVAAFEQSFHTPDTYSVPLLVSMGPDETLGLYEPNDGVNYGYLAQPHVTATTSAEFNAVFDNITNQQQ